MNTPELYASTGEPTVKRPRNFLKRSGRKKDHAKGAFGKCRGPFDPRPALSPKQMREKAKEKKL